MNRTLYKFNFISATLLLWLSGCVFTLAQDDGDVTTSDLTTAIRVQPDTIDVENISDDEAIADRLQSILEATQWFTEPKVVSNKGVVTLSGQADSDEHRVWAEQLAKRTQDVVSVSNNIEAQAVDFSSSWTVILDSLKKQWKDLLAQTPLLFAALIVIILTIFAARISTWLVHRVFKTERLRQSLKDLMALLAWIATWVVGLLIAATVAFPGMTPSKALTVLGLGSVAIGFAFKDIFENFFAGVLILWRYPLDRGDILKIGDIVGRVENITVRNTMIRRLSGELTVVPNANIFKQEVDVLTNHKLRRVELVCGIAYGEDVDESREVILKAVNDCQTVDASKAVLVLADCFGDSSINFDILWWTKAAPLEVRKSRDEVVSAVKRALDKAGIEIPFPYRTLTFKEPEKFAALLNDSQQSA